MVGPNDRKQVFQFDCQINCVKQCVKCKTQSVYLIMRIPWLRWMSWGSQPFIHTSIVRVGQHRCECVDRTCREIQLATRMLCKSEIIVSVKANWMIMWDKRFCGHTWCKAWVVHKMKMSICDMVRQKRLWPWVRFKGRQHWPYEMICENGWQHNRSWPYEMIYKNDWQRE